MWRSLALALLALSCATPTGERELRRTGDEIVVCGRLFHTGARVVTWLDAGGFDAYRGHRHRQPDKIEARDREGAARYGTRRRNLPDDVAARVHARGWELADLQQVVSQVVVHYDAAGTSAQCFKILHDLRGLSAHFLIDVDGTIYQTLDCKERAWHAGSANDRSVGIEIAQIGAYPDETTLAKWYAFKQGRPALELPAWVSRGELPEGTYEPARPGVIRGAIHGAELVQFDYTDAQYEALAGLLAALAEVFPRVALDTPRDEAGAVVAGLVEDIAAFEGIVGHYHLTKSKIDPGPAFDWARVLKEARAR